MWLFVIWWKFTNVSSFLVACFLLANQLGYSSSLKIDAVWSSPMSVNFCQTARSHIPKDNASVLLISFQGVSPLEILEPVVSWQVCIATASTRLRSTQSPIQWVPGVKRPGRVADQSPPASAEVNKVWIYTTIPPYAFMEQCLIS
jgi:hypothetical protein